jgi:hypothetical protein
LLRDDPRHYARADRFAALRARLATGGNGVWKDVLDPSFANPETVSANTLTVTVEAVDVQSSPPARTPFS